MADINEGCGCGCGSSCGPSRTAGGVLRTDAKMSIGDRLGTLRVRLGIRRNSYTVTPGLYALGRPGPESPVFVSANYKLSFDILRTSLGGIDAWILVLDTRGINVWCAAGRGTFGTDELVSKIKETGLGERVTGRRIIVPQLGAPGVAAHEVRRRTGFTVVYGPVRAHDIPEFMRRGFTADADMRRVRFNTVDRVKLIFIEWMHSLKYLVAAAIVLFGIAFFTSGFKVPEALRAGMIDFIGVAVAFACGTVLTPLFLPFIPGRSFSLKGLILGALGGIIFAWAAGKGIVEAASWVSASAAVSSFFAMGFTGSSTYTSLSGTVKEMRRYIPVQIGAGAAAVLLFAAATMMKTVFTG